MRSIGLQTSGPRLTQRSSSGGMWRRCRLGTGEALSRRSTVYIRHGCRVRTGQAEKSFARGDIAFILQAMCSQGRQQLLHNTVAA